MPTKSKWNNIKRIWETKSIIHVEEDLECLKKFKDNYFDWVYIDLSHDYNHSMQELKILKNKVKKSGIICGHDW